MTLLADVGGALDAGAAGREPMTGARPLFQVGS